MIHSSALRRVTRLLACLLVGLNFAQVPALAQSEVQNFTGTYAGVFLYGAGYAPAQGAVPVKFKLKLKQEPGEHSFAGTIEEEYSGFGVTKDNKLWALVQGEFTREKGKLKMRLVKTYRYFEQPSVSYTGFYDPARKSFDGAWGFSGTAQRGTFTLQRLATP